MGLIAFSHSSLKVAIADGNNKYRDSVYSTLMIVDLGSRTVTARSDFKVWDIWDLRFSPDDAEVIALTKAGAILQFDPMTARVIAEGGASLDSLNSATISPDGSKALLANAGEPPAVWKRRNDGTWEGPFTIPHGSKDTLTRGLGRTALDVSISPDGEKHASMVDRRDAHFGIWRILPR
ncbi:MAG: hypothetical protein WAN65_26605 [Candidatus Sulfotelmatobacter sp.]